MNTPSTTEHPSSGKVDVLVASAGTGGTVTGVSRALKKTHNASCHVVGVDPVSFTFTAVLPVLTVHMCPRKAAY